MTINNQRPLNVTAMAQSGFQQGFQRFRQNTPTQTKGARLTRDGKTFADLLREALAKQGGQK